MAALATLGACAGDDTEETPPSTTTTSTPTAAAAWLARGARAPKQASARGRRGRRDGRRRAGRRGRSRRWRRARLATEGSVHGRSGRQRRRRAAGRRRDLRRGHGRECRELSLLAHRDLRRRSGRRQQLRRHANQRGVVQVHGKHERRRRGERTQRHGDERLVTPRRFSRRTPAIPTAPSSLCAIQRRRRRLGCARHDCGHDLPHPVPHRRRPYTMVDPEISITPAPDGALCADSDRSLGAQFPLETVGEFTADRSSRRAACSRHQRRLYSYAPPASGWYEIAVTNQTGPRLLRRSRCSRAPSVIPMDPSSPA